MPTYEYECLTCGHHFEISQMMSAKRIKVCPKCGKAVRRLIGKGSGIIFKGSGFYATDYRKGKDLQSAPCKDTSGSQKDALKNTGNQKGKTCPKDKNSDVSSCKGCSKSSQAR